MSRTIKATFGPIALLVAILVALPLFAAEPGKPIDGTDVGLDHEPGGGVVSRTQTNRAGVAVFQNVKPGKYRISVNGIFDRWGPESMCPCIALLQIAVPGQKRISDNESPRPQNRSMKTPDTRFVPFTVAGNKVQTVTITITKVGAGQLQLPRT
jgi:hypothetical protein